MRNRCTLRLLGALCVIACIIAVVHSSADAALTDKQMLGKLLFFDTSLSSPDGQSCASCHDPKAGFADPDTNLPTSVGVLKSRVGSRNAPTVTYLATAPDFTFNPATGAFSGGQFWDGRALNLVEQAKGPFVNPIEMHNPNRKLVIHDIQKASYSWLFQKVYGKNIYKNYDMAYNAMAEAIAEYQKSPELNRFDSKFDYFLAGHPEALTDQEKLGLEVFTGKGNCSGCHRLTAGDPKPVFTSFGFANIGVPQNADNPFYYTIPSINPDGYDFVDLGLGGFLLDSGASPGIYEPQLGKMGFPTVRNIALTSPYFHNGVFKDLETVVHFFNTRDVPAAGWPPPEVPLNVSQAVGNLGLTAKEELAVVAFMRTLTDGYKP